MIEKIKSELLKLKNKKQAETFKKFFKTSKGEYASKDIFLGIGIPKQRKIAKKYIYISLNEIKVLLEDKIHEYRMTAGIILVEKFNLENQKEIVEFYIKNAKLFNSWDLVDLTAPKILGKFLINQERKILTIFSKSKNIWERRISVVSTHAFIKNGEIFDALKICKTLLKDEKDLIKKAVGWTLREIGNKDKKTLKNFLIENYENISRVTLRYAIEKFSKEERKFYLSYKLSSGLN
jgi:3-methyladenine DNA glycosylase AlkD